MRNKFVSAAKLWLTLNFVLKTKSGNCSSSLKNLLSNMIKIAIKMDVFATNIVINAFKKILYSMRGVYK